MHVQVQTQGEEHQGREGYTATVLTTTKEQYNKNKKNDSRNNRDRDTNNENTTMIAEKTTKTTKITIISFYHEFDILFLSFQQLLFIKKTGADGPPRQHSFLLNLCTLYFRKSWRSLCLFSIDQIRHQDA